MKTMTMLIWTYVGHSRSLQGETHYINVFVIIMKDEMDIKQRSICMYSWKEWLVAVGTNGIG